MSSNSIWEFLSGIPIGIVAGWIIVIISIIGMISAGTIKLYKVFEKYSKLKEENDEQKKMLQQHETTLNNINASLNKLTAAYEEQKEVNLKQLRCTMVHICDEAIAAEKISAGKLRSLEEMYEEYVKIFHGNGYVKSLVNKVRELPIYGTLEE